MTIEDRSEQMREDERPKRSPPPLPYFVILSLLLLFRPAAAAPVEIADAQTSSNTLKQQTLEQLGNVEVTTVLKEPEELWKTAAAVYVITDAEIQRSGATTIPEALRLAPGVALP
jgi:iron complex outermembrane receptor protein